MSEAGDTWVALLHRPTDPSVVGAVVADPRFGDHVGSCSGWPRPATSSRPGSLADGAGEGMTVLRLPDPDRLDEATRLATEDDASVAGGLLQRRGSPLVGGHARLIRRPGSGCFI